MTGRNIGGIPGFDEAVEEVKEYMESGGDDRIPAEGTGTTSLDGRKDQIEMITIKFAKKLVGEPFTSKKGKELVEILIPNSDPADKRPWQTFVLAARDVHENKYGKGMWAKIPANGHTTVSRSVVAGEKDGKKQWRTEKTVVTNSELKEKVEFYRQNRRESLKDQMAKAAEEGHSGRTGKPPGYGDREEVPFR